MMENAVEYCRRGTSSLKTSPHSSNGLFVVIMTGPFSYRLDMSLKKSDAGCFDMDRCPGSSMMRRPRP
jgi:hypothetical protein